MVRAAMVAVLIALLCGDARPAPAKKRTGTFAKYIDPAAPDDPPRKQRAGPRPTWLSVVFLIDRATDAPTLEKLLAAEETLHRSLENEDAAAVMTFASSVDTVVRANTAAKTRDKLATALARITPSDISDVAAGLAAAREYMARAPDRKLIILFTDAGTSASPLATAVAALREARIELIVVVPDQAAALALTFEPELAIFALGRGSADYIAWWISTLHDRSR